MVTDQALAEVALSRQEYTQLVEDLGREPNHLELGMFGAMWSEHCGYKNSRPLLKPASRPAGRGCSRDRARTPARSISATGWLSSSRSSRTTTPARSSRSRARPRRRRHRARHLHDGRAAGRHPQLASLRPARPTPQRATSSSGVVAGIGGYGNCLGIPTVGGEVSFDRVMPAIRSSTPCASASSTADGIDAREGDRRRQLDHARRRRHRSRWASIGATVRLRRLIEKSDRSRGLPSRSATHSSRSC